MINKKSVHQYRVWRTEKMREDLGFLDQKAYDEIEQDVKRYAIARRDEKDRLNSGYFNPFTDDPRCKSCGKKKGKSNDSRNVNIQPKDSYIFVPRAAKED